MLEATHTKKIVVVHLKVKFNWIPVFLFAKSGKLATYFNLNLFQEAAIIISLFAYFARLGPLDYDIQVYFWHMESGDTYSSKIISFFPPFSSFNVCACIVTHVWLFATPGTVAHQPPGSTGFCRQEYWSGLPFPPPGDLLDPGIEPVSPLTPALAVRFFTTEPPVKSFSFNTML